ncbi:hypothetical protein A9C19_18665 [Bacillus weihaiensis]|uniref:Uncharacterized protein n=1 Tax=Bacillus weihaiensis TaxID=1547283 RepID=A0A1L3MWB0_9BACI|nr:hypothetical protein A9C19_18665 [Bacillus weihaiensis]
MSNNELKNSELATFLGMQYLINKQPLTKRKKSSFLQIILKKQEEKSDSPVLEIIKKRAVSHPF